MVGVMMIGASPAAAADKTQKKPNAFSQIGQASWYDYRSQGGRKTASGQRLDNRTPTAAHKTLPFGSRIKVTNIRNGKSVVVVINDRGPFRQGRIIDLNRLAAQRIGMIAAGTAKVKIEAIIETTEIIQKETVLR